MNKPKTYYPIFNKITIIKDVIINQTPPFELVNITESTEPTNITESETTKIKKSSPKLNIPEN